MTTSRIVSSARFAGLELHVVGGTLAADESWSPYCTGTLIIPTPAPDVYDQLDPRRSPAPRITADVAQEFGTPFTLAQLPRSAASGWATTAAWTADLEGRPLSWWTGRYSLPFNAFGMRASRVRSFDLQVRGRSRDAAAGTTTLTLASDEAALQDIANTHDAVLAPPTDTVVGVVTLALEAIGAVVDVDTDDIDDVALEAGSTGWEPGVSGWDYAAPLVDAAGMRLWCDEQRVWHLTETGRLTDGYVTLTADTATQLDDDTTRDDQWYDAVVVTYRWRDGSDVERTRRSIAAPIGHSRVYGVTYDRPYPGGRAADAILTRSGARGRTIGVQAVLDPSASPGQAFRLSGDDASGAPLTGFVQQVQWNLDADTMLVRARDVAATPATAWALAVGSWQDVAGVPWADITDERLSEEG